MIIMTLEQQLATLQSERQSIQNLMEGLREKSLALFDQIESIKDQIAEQKIQQSNEPDWEFLLKNDNGTVTLCGNNRTVNNRTQRRCINNNVIVYITSLC